MMGSNYGYGLWIAVIINVMLILAFVLSFLAPKGKWEWRSLGLFTGFLVAPFLGDVWFSANHLYPDVGSWKQVPGAQSLLSYERTSPSGVPRWGGRRIRVDSLGQQRPHGVRNCNYG